MREQACYERKEGFIDVRSYSNEARASLNRFVLEDDYLWDSTSVRREATLAKTLPAMFTCGSTVVERGKPHFKGPPLAECPRCRTKPSNAAARS